MKWIVGTWIGLLTLTVSSGSAWAAETSKTAVRLIGPAGPGGVIDIRARWLAQRLEPVLQVPVMVDNRPGAGGNIGTEAGVRSAPDGNTIVVVHQGIMAINPHLYRGLTYDPLADLKVVTRLGVGPQVLAVHADVPAPTLAMLIQLARSRPGQLAYGSPGIGTPPHLACELFKMMTGIEAPHGCGLRPPQPRA